MHNIDPKFLNADGTINYEAAMTAGRKARAKTAGVGFNQVCKIARQLLGHGNQLAEAAKQHDPSLEGSKS